MRVFIKYNPNTLSTEITVNGKPVKPNSQLNVGNVQLADWIDDLPEIIEEEYSTSEFELVFRGTVRDYALVAEVVERAEEDGFEISLNHILAKYDKKENKKFAPKVNSFENFAQNYSEDEELVPFFDDEEEQKQISSGRYDEDDEDFEDNRRLSAPKQKAENDYEYRFYSENPPSSNVKRIFIKYNPYVPYTHITVEGNEPKPNSRLNIGNLRLQEWIEKLPEILSEEYYARRYKIGFHGISLDYEDIFEVAKDSNIIEVIHYPAKEVKDKENLIQQIFDEIQKGPFDELRDKNVVNAFNKAKDSDFEVDVVATMSAGKSTLINSLLGQKLMPSSNEACTAIITRIKDSKEKNFSAKVIYGDKSIKSYSSLNYEKMQDLNKDKNVIEVHLNGNIPFVTSDDISLVLVDTPGPNNSRDKEHEHTTYGVLDIQEENKKTTHSMLTPASKTLVLYIMNATQLKVNDDNIFLEKIAKSMEVEGKKSRDRFLFVVNKLDAFDENDNVKKTLDSVVEYLKCHGIENPNIYPASAKVALDIRTILTNPTINSKPRIIKQAESLVEMFNEEDEMHFEKYASLAPSSKKNIENILNKAENDEDVNTQALVHCGIIPLEEAIKIYVHKYAKPMKIRNLVDTFKGKLESQKFVENLKNAIRTDEEQREKILTIIASIEEKLNNAEEAKKFKSKIDSIDFEEDIRDGIDDIRNRCISKYNRYIEELELEDELPKWKAEDIYSEFKKFSSDLKIEFEEEMKSLVDDRLIRVANILLQQYREKLDSLTQELGLSEENINVDPSQIIGGYIPTGMTTGDDISDIINTHTETVRTKRGFFKKLFSWDWDEYDVSYRTREYVKTNTLMSRYLDPVKIKLVTISEEMAQSFNDSLIEPIKQQFYHNFNELDRLLDRKIKELKEYGASKENYEKSINELNKRLTWLNNISEKLNSIIEI